MGAATRLNIIKPDWKVRASSREDRNFLQRAGVHSSEQLDKADLQWSPPNSISQDLLSMDDKGWASMRRAKALSAQDLSSAVEGVGREACRLFKEWPANPSDDEARAGRNLADHGASLWNTVAIIAILAEALTIPGAIDQFGPDAVRLVHDIIQLFGHYALELFENVKIEPPPFGMGGGMM